MNDFFRDVIFSIISGVNMTTQKKPIMKTVEASLQCNLIKADVTGSEELDIGFKIKIISSQASDFIDAVENGCLKSAELNGKVERVQVKCECCQKVFKQVFNFIFMFSDSTEITCKDCEPVRETGRTAQVCSDDNKSQVENSSKESSQLVSVEETYESDFDSVTNEKLIPAEIEASEIRCDLESKCSEQATDFTCQICNASFSDECFYTDHLMDHASLNPCQCPVCGKNFTNKYILKKHLRNHLPDEKRPFRCDSCGKGFIEACYYREHVKGHEEKKLYKCGDCDRRYSSSTTLRRHQRAHSNCRNGQGNLTRTEDEQHRQEQGNLTRTEDEQHRQEQATVNDSNTQEKSTKAENDEHHSREHEKEKNRKMQTKFTQAEDEEKNCFIKNVVSVQQNKMNLESVAQPVNNQENSDKIDSEDNDVDSEGQIYCDSSQTKTYLCMEDTQIKSHKSEHRLNTKRTYKCDKCGGSFTARPALMSHMKEHTPDNTVASPISSQKGQPSHYTRDRPFSCATCGKSFFSKQVMEKHSSKHLPEHLWKQECEICQKKFSHKSFLQFHMLSHQKDRPHKCDQCDNTYASLKSLSRHKAFHSFAAHNCLKCGQRFQSAIRLKEHKYIHDGVVPFCCEVCGKGFKLQSVLKTHARTHLGRKPFACEKCSKQWYTQHDLDIHMRVHSGERPFMCDVCGRTYTTKNTLQRHNITHSKEFNILKSCKICGKKFKGGRALVRHEQTHQPEYKYPCELCEKRFPSSKALWSHNQTHKGAKPHECAHCGKKFRSVTHCKNHTKTHTREDLYQCSACKDWFTSQSYVEKVHPKYCKANKVPCHMCNREFINSQALQSHIGLHTGERPFGCETCGRSFSKEAALSEHVKRHLEEKSHVCQNCGKEFNHAADLRKHEQRHRRVMKHEENTIMLEAAGESDPLPLLSGPGTVLEEVQDVPNMEKLPTEHVVLATIDPGLISEFTQLPSRQTKDQKQLEELQNVHMVQEQGVIVLEVVHETE